MDSNIYVINFCGSEHMVSSTLIYHTYSYTHFHNLEWPVYEENGKKMNVDHRNCRLQGLMNIEV